jgi:ribonuclease BN (tRNA processing enzyme)
LPIIDYVKFQFLGTGSAFTKTNYQSNMLVEHEGQRMLVDCGGTAPVALMAAGYTLQDIDALYVSHQHSDHIGGIEEVAFVRFFTAGKPRPKLFVDAKLADDLWNHSLKGGLASLEGLVCTLDTYFDVHRVPMNGTFDFAGVNFRPVQTVHIMNGYGIVPSYGLLWTSPKGAKVFLTTDTQFAPNQIMKFYKSADYIFQDCETAAVRSGVHAHYDELKTLPEDVKRKMHLYHYQDGDRPDAAADGFAGFVDKGQIFEL